MTLDYYFRLLAFFMMSDMARSLTLLKKFLVLIMNEFQLK